MQSAHKPPQVTTMSNDPNNGKITATKAAQHFLNHRKEEVRDKTLSSQSTPVNHFAEWCEQNNRQLAALNGFDLQEFYDHMKNNEGYAITTLKTYMAAVKQFLIYLERLDAAPDGINEKVHLPSLDKNQRRRDTEIEPERVKETIQWLEQFKYASRDHAIMLILWRCGIRRGSLYSLDLQDFTELKDVGHVLELKHRPKTNTPLKNGSDGERPININESAARAIQDYIDHNRIDATDENGRQPLITSNNGRYSKDQYRKTALYYTCPQTSGIGNCSCETDHTKETAGKCEKSVSPHVIRSASITYWRQNDVPVEVVSDRMNVSQQTLELHYDRRTEEGKARQRKKFVDNIE